MKKAEIIRKIDEAKKLLRWVNELEAQIRFTEKLTDKDNLDRQMGERMKQRKNEYETKLENMFTK